ncbi:hypothetical protein [Cellulomonas sp. 73-145]|uniref:hypothetical protein n=1 Tax=Cellulomonas sp. 73-145 TaxID=1895739 RepID=UPI001AD5E1D1|nr:hypothetical protein [Cellulomonas sp. 73-145]MBN9325614.1 hypothetical protein [Cellulomonas sp.]
MALVVAVVLLIGSVGASVAWATVSAVSDRGVLRPWDGMPGMHRGWDRGDQPYQGMQPGQRNGQGGGWRGTGPGVGPGVGPRVGPGFGPGMHRGYGPGPVPSPSASPSS